MEDDHVKNHGGPAPSSTTTTTTTNSAYLDATRSERSVWLMKCPPLLTRSIQTSDPSRPFGKVVVSIDPLSTDNDSPKFTMVLPASDSGNPPDLYKMEMSKDFIPMCVFSESTQGRLAVEGKVLNKFDVRPRTEDFDSYGKLCRERTKKHMIKNRQIKVIDNDNGTNMRPLPGMVGLMNMGCNEKKKVSSKGSEMKRTRRDRGEMEEVLFKLFERQPNWTLRHLIQETDQPEVMLFSYR
uniref:Transcription initiation factor IIF subunit beta n=1 Tax=Kalanchoe fedtschenkoi TaxID=63787 RepID=A0A7N1A7R3_KALFE